MRFMRLGIWLVVATLAASGVAHAQSTTGTISGRVVDAQERTVPGVTVSVESANLQGIRTAVTSENGDYIFTLLPSGAIHDHVRAERIRAPAADGQRSRRRRSLPVDVTMGLAGVSETVEVVGRAADVLTQTAQVAINCQQDLISTLPTNRDINAALLLAPSVHPTGPSGNYSIAGSMSYENLFMVNGVTVNENLRGQAQQSLHRGRDSGNDDRHGRRVGRVRAIRRRRRQHGHQVGRQPVRGIVPRHVEQRQLADAGASSGPATLFANDTKLDKIVPTYEYTFGGPVMRDRLWFFTAGRFQEQQSARQLVADQHPLRLHATTRSATRSTALTRRLRTTVSRARYIKETFDQLNNTFNRRLRWIFAASRTGQQPQDLFTVNYSGILTPSFFIEGRYSQRNFTFIGSGSKSTDIIDGTLLIDQREAIAALLVADLLRRLHAPRSATTRTSS